MPARMLLAAYLATGVADVAGEALGATALTTVAKPLLVPLLAAWLLVATRGTTLPAAARRWLAAGLAFAWLGDLLLMGSGDAFFMGGLAAFLAMQVCYIVAFQCIPGPGLIRAWRIALVPFVVYWAGMNLVLVRSGGSMTVPVLVYSAVLLAMAAAALDLVLRVPRPLGWRVFWGAALFVVSDSLIALEAFGPLNSARWLNAVVMATYVAAQAMIVTGFAGCLVSGSPNAGGAGAPAIRPTR